MMRPVVSRSITLESTWVASRRAVEARRAKRRASISCAFAVVLLALVLVPQDVLGKPPSRPDDCIPANDRTQCERDRDCCEGAVCAGRCRRGCKIFVPDETADEDNDGDGINDKPVFYENGAINPENDCQWCQSAIDRFGWTNLATGTACGDQTTDECTNPDTCDGAGTCLLNDEPTTTTCGDDEGACTNQDYCDGAGGCTDNGYKPATTACGDPTDDECNNPDHCSGIDGSCIDEVEPVTTACGDAEAECTDQDYCDGTGKCEDMGFKPSSTACGDPSDDECDHPDHCSGVDATCEPNYEASGAQCGDTESACTYADTCDGSGGCTDNGFKPSTTRCGDQSDGECDHPDYCSGVDDTCLPNYDAEGTPCGDEEGPCTYADACNGLGRCTDNGFKPAATACGDQTDDACNNPDHCSGVDGSCINEVEPNTTPCGDSEQQCRYQDYCDGGGTCEDNGFKPVTTACGDPTENDCNLADHCSGVDSSCVSAVEPAGTPCGETANACTNQDTCDGSGSCNDNGFKDSAALCTGTANGGPCDDDAKDHCNGSGACVDAYKPTSFACVLPRDGFGNYTCKEVVYCTGDGSTCPAPDINVYDPTIPCRETRSGSFAVCDPPEYCIGYGQCAPQQQVDATCVGGPRNGQWCDIYAEEELNQPQCGTGGTCVRTVCPGRTQPCENDWVCQPGGACVSNGMLPAGTDCIGEDACEKYSCDATGACVDQNVTRSETALCREAASECDVRDFCGNPDAVNTCSVSGTPCVGNGDCPSGETCVLESRGRSDFEDYPACGPDLKKPYGTPCTYQPLGEAAPGVCIAGECNPIYCKFSIECPDGWVCGCPPGETCPKTYCVPAPADGGYGDTCAIQGYCNAFAEVPGKRCDSDAICNPCKLSNSCTPENDRVNAKCLQSSCDFQSGIREGVGCETDAECRNATHPFGRCVLETQGTCGSYAGGTFDYVCCAGMAGDGHGARPALGQTGRCQECCGGAAILDENCSDQQNPDGSTFVECCDGKCVDTNSDIEHCVSCSYDGGYDCRNLINACTPGVVSCDALTVSDGCIMEYHCDGTADDNGWTAAACYIPEVQLAVADCDYCVFPSATPGEPCLTDADCGGFPGTCYHDPSLFCFVDRLYARTTSPECATPPFTGCAPTCCEIDNNPNVGAECESDSQCFGGTSCITSCDIDRHGQVFGAFFCGSSPTCQFIGGEQPEFGCEDVPYP